jgi:hypothetical protein
MTEDLINRAIKDGYTGVLNTLGKVYEPSRLSASLMYKAESGSKSLFGWL